MRADLAGPVAGTAYVGLSPAQRLAAGAEPALNVPTKISAQVRLFGHRSGRKTDARSLRRP